MCGMDALPPVIAERLEQVRSLCETHHVKRLTLFGSAVKGTFDPERSDVDFLVEFYPLSDPMKAGRAYLDLWEELKSLFQRDVDLVDVKTINNVYLAESIRRAQLDVYAAA
jgi:predicted nucleotidyltransferase